MNRLLAPLAALMTLSLAACDDPEGPATSQEVMSFRACATAVPGQPRFCPPGFTAPAGDLLTMTGLEVPALAPACQLNTGAPRTLVNVEASIALVALLKQYKADLSKVDFPKPDVTMSLWHWRPDRCPSSMMNSSKDEACTEEYASLRGKYPLSEVRAALLPIVRRRIEEVECALKEIGVQP